MTAINYLNTIPAILGLTGFVIYFILKKSSNQDSVIGLIIEKIKRESPDLYDSIIDLSPIQKAKIIKENINFRAYLSKEELIIVDKTLHKQFILSIYVYSLVSLLLVFGIGLFIYQAIIPKPLQIDNIYIQNTDSISNKKPLIDLDPIIITWTSTGRDEVVYVALENVETGSITDKKRVQASECKIVFKPNIYSNFDKILKNRMPLQSNRIRAFIFGSKEAFKSKEFEIKVGVKVMAVGSLPDKIEFFATIDNVIIDNYRYMPRLMLFKKGGYTRDYRVQFMDREYAPRHFFRVSNPKEINWDSFIITLLEEQDKWLVRSEVDFTDFKKL